MMEVIDMKLYVKFLIPFLLTGMFILPIQGMENRKNNSEKRVIPFINNRTNLVVGTALGAFIALKYPKLVRTAEDFTYVFGGSFIVTNLAMHGLNYMLQGYFPPQDTNSFIVEYDGKRFVELPPQQRSFGA
jgi:hypothetical protein